MDISLTLWQPATSDCNYAYKLWEIIGALDEIVEERIATVDATGVAHIRRAAMGVRVSFEISYARSDLR